ncbi:MAG: hypothetical protein WC277_02105 [Bacilli bacterium]
MNPGPLDLTMTGEKIHRVVTAAVNMANVLSPLSLEDLDDFDAYLSRLEAGLPVTDPTTWIKFGPQIPRARSRVNLVRAVLEYREQYGPDDGAGFPVI